MSIPAWDQATPENGTFNISEQPLGNFEFAPPMQNAQIQQRMQNGRNGSPPFQDAAYKTNPVIPAKRGVGELYNVSPRQTSRSNTPQQPFPNFTNGLNNNQAPMQFQQHLQQPNSTPSPIMHNQQFNPQNMSQRMQTASPAPFSPAGPGFLPQGSPPHSDYGSRGETPQNGAQPPFMPGQQFAANAGQNFTSTPPPGSAAPYPPNAAVFAQQQQRMHELRQQNMIRQLQAQNNAAQQRHQVGGQNPMMNPTPQIAVSLQQQQQQQQQQAAARIQLQQQNMQRMNPEAFVRNVSHFMNSRGLQFNPNVSISGRLVPAVQIYGAVMVKFGGSKKVTEANAWPTVAAALQFHPQQFPSAGHELQNYWNSNLFQYEQMMIANMQQQRARASMGQRQQPEQAGLPTDPAAANRMSIGANIAALQAQKISGPGFQTPTKPPSRQSQDLRGQTNGLSTSQQAQMINQMPSQPPINLRQPPPSQVTTSRLQHGSASPAVNATIKQASTNGPENTRPESEAEAESEYPPIHQRSSEFKPIKTAVMRESKSSARQPSETHGGVEVKSGVLAQEVFEQLINIRPDVPHIDELGVVDIRALNLSLKSGLHGEVRLALDHLWVLTRPPNNNQIALEQSEDLLDSIVECAEEQIDLLAENSPEVSDELLVNSYEEVLRACQAEILVLQDVPEFGTLEYTLDRSVERLVAITSILRNLSDSEANQRSLADENVVKMITSIIRHLGTRHLFLRKQTETLEVVKNILIFLSNVSQWVDLPAKEDALCILHFLLSFAPYPPPATQDHGELFFSPYSPKTHRYLARAVDCLSKTLARDDPNRTFYKAIFAADAAATPPFELLTRTFALAVSPIPDLPLPPRPLQPMQPSAPYPIVEIRKPYLLMGILAAELLLNLVPPTEHGLVRSWLSSQDGWAENLLKLVANQSRITVHARVNPQTSQVIDPDPEGHLMLTNHGVTLLRRLAERGRDPEKSQSLPVGLHPKKNVLLESLSKRELPPSYVRSLCVLAGLDV